MLRPVLIVAATVACLAIPAAAHAAGSPDVAALQVALRSSGVDPGPVDGVLGPQTALAIRSFQARRGLVADGVAGPRTRAALGRRAGPELGRRRLERGAVGGDVTALQFALARNGAPSGRLDGRFGWHVDAAVRRFQAARGLAVDGVVGSATLAALLRPVPRPAIALGFPVAGPASDGFGPRGDRFHAGVDFRAPAGAPVVAAARGRVAFGGFRPGGHGVTVVLAHGRGVRTLYAHLSAASVAVGARVARGAPIGRVGATGNSTGPHLHFEVRVRGLAVDPSPLLEP